MDAAQQMSIATPGGVCQGVYSVQGILCTGDHSVKLGGGRLPTSLLCTMYVWPLSPWMAPKPHAHAIINAPPTNTT